MEARNRSHKDWYGMIQRGEIKLPRFQRHEAWDRQRICSLMDMVIRDLPLGITLTLTVADKEPFISRFLETAEPEGTPRVLELLLDGQQRLTALWRVFHNNYERETYFVYLKEFDRYIEDKELRDLSTYCRTRYTRQNGGRYPLWCDDPVESLKRGLIPTQLLRPEDLGSEIDDWIEAATAPMEPKEGIAEIKAFGKLQRRISDRIKDLRSIVANYNLPYLSLTSDTEKSVALDVFIKMNTNAKPLTQYDVIVAEVESVAGRSLHDLHEALARKYPAVQRYGDLSDLILTTSALLQDALPNQRGAWDMNKEEMVEKWETMETGLSRMADFLRSEGIPDRQRLPTNAVLAVIAALYADIPTSGDKRGRDELLLKKYLWRAFFTDRYENAAATNAYADFVALKRIIRGERKADGTAYDESDIPIFAAHSLIDEEELLAADWPRRNTIHGRAALAVACRLGALDFATGERLDVDNVRQRQYHHLYPDALLKEEGINSFQALNCALISDTTNMTIGRKDPVEYLRDRFEWTSEEIVRERLHSHLLPIPELANGGYEGLTEPEKGRKLGADFELFLQRRAKLVMKAARQLVEGRQISAIELFSDEPVKERT
ncbi:MAG: DUF262 domain-containing protein [Anaerolineaceae bacterium]|nr:DUF262 domain-containing protein [Anaerolineaceae bacterium]